MPTSHTNDYRFGYSHRELERLGNQHRVWAEDNRRFLAWAGFGKGATVVDLGCGPGHTTLDLASVVGPEGRVIAVDRDGERSLPLLKDRAEATGILNVETRAVELEDFDLPEDSLDGVYARWVLMYLPEKAAAALIGRVASWLRQAAYARWPNSATTDTSISIPPSVHLPAIAEALFRAVAEDQEAQPGDWESAPGLLLATGLQIELRVV